MTRRRETGKAPAEISAARIDAADRITTRPKRKPPVDTGFTRADGLLAMPRRPAAEGEQPVDVSSVNWREARPWEWTLIEQARRGERRNELHLFDGVGP